MDKEFSRRLERMRKEEGLVNIRSTVVYNRDTTVRKLVAVLNNLLRIREKNRNNGELTPFITVD